MPYPKHYALLALMLALSAQHVVTATHANTDRQSVQRDLSIALTTEEKQALTNIASFMEAANVEMPAQLQSLFAIIGNVNIPLQVMIDAIVAIHALLTEQAPQEIALALAEPLKGLSDEDALATRAITSSGGSSYVYGISSNNISIGDSNVGGALTTGTDNTAFGVNSLVKTTSGSQNTAVGSNALYNNLVGSNNMAFGYQALYSNTGGTENTAIGNQSMYTNTSGDHNVAFGASALYSNTVGNDNTSFGYHASYGNTAGNNNIAIGASSLYTNTIGSDNIALGINALKTNTASYNTAIGANALTTNSSGINNVAIGRQSMKSSTTGDNNAAIGTQTLYSNTTGQNNAAIGSSALYANTTGTQNTAIGASSLSQNTTSSDSTAIGSNALNSSTGQQCVAVGSQALAKQTSGYSNTALGYKAGNSITTGNTNIYIGHVGAATESNAIRLGTLTTHTSCYIAGAVTMGDLTTANLTVTGFARLNSMLLGTTAQDHSLTGTLTVGRIHAAGSAIISGATTVTGITNINASNNAATNIGTGTTTSTVTIGNAANILAVNSNGTTLNGNITVTGFARINTKLLLGDSDDNTVAGKSAGAALVATSAIQNTLFGFEAGKAVTTGDNNVLIGYQAGKAFTTGSSNICLGKGAGASLATSDANNIMIGAAGVGGVSNAIRIGVDGTHSKAYFEGVSGITTDVADAANVMISATGHQLGTVSSSRRYKDNIKDLDVTADDLLKLRPVSFNYKKHTSNDVQYGLVAEEVAEVLPRLVIYKDNQPETIRYHFLPTLLLSGHQAHDKRLCMVEAKADTLDSIVERLNRIEEILKIQNS